MRINARFRGQIAMIKSFSQVIITALLCGCLLQLLACGGSGSSSGDTTNDTTPPTISILGDNPLDITQGDTFNDPGAQATDNLDGDLAVAVSGTVDTDTIGSYTITYIASDAANNNASATRTVNVVAATQRPANNNCIPPPSTTTNLQASFQASFTDLPQLPSPMAMVQPQSDSGFWLVALRDGRIVMFDNQNTANSTTEILDISAKVATNFELGFTGLAIHPDYPQDNRIFVVYNDASQQKRSTVSSFLLNTTTHIADPDSEQVLLTVNQPADNHNGGDIAFGPDGMLYVAFGDGGAVAGESQDLSNLLGSMIRIDVSGAAYSIPADNPFNSGQALCSSGERNAGDTTTCPEIYAYGFRNPWRWSFDSQNGDIWLADVGQSTWEEVDKVISGGNYGWPIMEGNACYNASNCDMSGLQLPITQYPRSVGISTVGGYVYRGSQSPALYGQYIWGDTLSEQFLSVAANAQPGADYSLIFSSRRTIAAMAEGNDGEIYLLNLSGGAGDAIFRVVATGSNVVEMPDNLSDVGCFDTQSKTSASGVVDYLVNSQLWSDGAGKLRSFAIPNNQTIQISANDGDFTFPTDTILIKHFLNGDRFLETRLLINHASGWAGYSYEWNDAQTDALLLSSGKSKDVGDFVHTFPSPSECAICHTDAANFSLGLEVSQLNLQNPQLNLNQLDFLSQAGYLSSNIQSDGQPQLYALDDSSATLQQKARSYLHSNCSGCHRPSSSTADSIDLRMTTDLVDTNTCNVEPTAGDLGVSGAQIIAPGNADASVLLLRMETLGSERMPPLATFRVDSQATQMIREWINSLQDCSG